MRVNEYNPCSFQNVNEITMEDIEQIYFSVLERKDGLVISMTAPLLVCMALWGESDKIWQLLEKFPLVDANGWTPELEEMQRMKKKSFLYVNGKRRERSWYSVEILTTTMALMFSDNWNFINCKKIYERAPLEENQLNWIEECADMKTKCTFYRFMYCMGKVSSSQNIHKEE